ncbi:unnamed protein product [Adineta steineri]|uniref:Uncharacterized protein n=2 Tax=Adineta steineri TaxID=433720 RepID=A0A819Q991_9BILA|nr:unnamed protein product [Adineta steineri]
MNNDLKYVLLPTVDDRRRSPKFQPWYRERIRMKYPCNINTKNWKFVKDGLDDFRDGLPPSHDDIMLQPEKGLGPVLISDHRRVKSSVARVQSRFSDHQMYYSREIPAAEKRRRTIDKYISHLLEHPVAFFEHFSRMLSPEIYERVTKLFEAELLRFDVDEHKSSVDEEKDSNDELIQTEINDNEPIDELSNDLTTKVHIDVNTQVTESSENKVKVSKIGRNGVVYDEAGNQWSADEYEKKQKNPYRWFIEKQRQKQRAKGPSQDEQAAAAMEVRLRSVSEQFCAWLYDLSAEATTDIDPAVVRNLFSTAYDTKPSLNVPIKVIEMTRVPVELREGVQDTMIPESEQPHATLAELRMAASSAKSREMARALIDDEPRTQKYRYGAWYLPKNLWHRTLITEELLDPKVLKAEREDVTRQREEQINARLAPLHGVNAFRDYLQDKNVRRLPKLITDVEQYRRIHLPETINPPTEFQTKRTGFSST